VDGQVQKALLTTRPLGFFRRSKVNSAVLRPKVCRSGGLAAGGVGDVADKRLDGQQGGSCDQALAELRRCIKRGTSLVSEQLRTAADYAADVATVWEVPNPNAATAEQRRDTFDKPGACCVGDVNPVYEHMSRTMQSFAPGLFACGDDPELPQDNLDFERVFGLPKNQECRIHGHAHAGVRIVQQGPSLALMLDAHARFTVAGAEMGRVGVTRRVGSEPWKLAVSVG